MIAAILAVTVGGVRVGEAVIARHRAQAAADLSALAAASTLPDGVDAACGAASAIASAMGAGVVDCTVEGLDVVVTVESGPAHAAARAGPAVEPA